MKVKLDSEDNGSDLDNYTMFTRVENFVLQDDPPSRNGRWRKVIAALPNNREADELLTLLRSLEETPNHARQ